MIETLIGLAAGLPGEWAQYTFMRQALLAVILIAPLFAFLGCLVVNNQMAFFSDAVGHSALTGIALGVLLGFREPFIPLVLFALVVAVGVVVLRRFTAASADTVISIVMSATVALGIVILSRGGGFARYTRYLVGDILSITPSDLLLLSLTAAAALPAWLFLFNRLQLLSLHTPLARSRGIKVWRWQVIFAALTAVIVAVSIQWIGILLINAMLILPAASARNLARNLAAYLWTAVTICLIAGVGGLIASYYLATATGATIVLAAAGFFALSLLWRKVRGD